MTAPALENIAIERIPATELEDRQERCRRNLASIAPDAGGLLAFSPVSIYYLSGHLANGVFWLPKDGAPVLFCRKGIERARLESSVETILPFRSFSDIPPLLAEAGVPLPVAPQPVAAEMNSLTWSLANLLTSRLKEQRFVPGDMALSLTRSLKTQWELAKLRLCGKRHDQGLQQLLPECIAPGMSERDVSHKAWEVFFSLGHSGLMRMSAPGEDIFLGHVSAGASANYPSRYNGPVGIMGEHPATPFMGYAGAVWTRNSLLTCDIGFCLEGYQTDKTQVYWGGAREDIPEEAARAHQLCVDVQSFIAENMKPGALPSELYTKSMEMVEKAGLLDGFMALDGNKVPFIGHGIGLAIDEYPVIAKGFDEPLEEGTVMALEPKMGMRGLGMVGVENTFEVTADGGRCLTGERFEIICVE